MKLDFYQDLHERTRRSYLLRMNDNKVEAMKVARRFDENFFDGSRRYGYGGYVYDGRWKEMAFKIVDKYKLNTNSKVMDLGCGLGHLAYEIRELSGCGMAGTEISQYAIDHNMLENVVKHDLRKEMDIFQPRPDLILCLNVLHNLTLPELKNAFELINRNSKKAYIVVDSYRNEQELTNLQCWALTAEQFLRPEEWEFLFKEWGYKGDWEFIYFE